jgi:hypothetical protein
LDPEIDEKRSALSRCAQNGNNNRAAYEEAAKEYYAALEDYRQRREKLPRPNTSLVIIDEADRLNVMSLEQVRDEFDRSDAGIFARPRAGHVKHLQSNSGGMGCLL